MIDWIKSNWKITAGVVVTALFIWWACCSGGVEVEEVPVVEEAPVEVVPEVEPAPVEE